MNINRRGRGGFDRWTFLSSEGYITWGSVDMFLAG